MIKYAVERRQLFLTEEFPLIHAEGMRGMGELGLSTPVITAAGKPQRWDARADKAEVGEKWDICTASKYVLQGRFLKL